MRILYLVNLIFLAPTGYSRFRSPSIASNSDGVIVKPRRVVIIRRGALVKEFPEKRRASVTYPIVSGLKDVWVLSRVQSILAVKNAFDSSIADYRQDSWLEEFTYRVNYNKKTHSRYHFHPKC